MPRKLNAFKLITDSFAEAAIDSSRWDSAMDRVSEATGGSGAALFHARERLPIIPKSRELAGPWETYVKDGWVQRDERYRVFPALMRRGVGTDLDFTTPEEIARHPYYQEFLRPFSLRWFAGVKVAAGRDVWCLSIQRTIDQGPFSAVELKNFARLSHHLSGAAELARAFGFTRAEASLTAFNLSRSAAVLIDRQGKVFRMNSSAERLIDKDFFVKNRRLTSIDRTSTADLDRALYSLIWSVDAPGLMPAVVLPRAKGRPILAYPSRLSGAALDVFAPCQAVIILRDLESTPTTSEFDVMNVLKLTPAEARLASSLSRGEALESAAQGIGVSYETARSLLKSIFHKSGTHKQAELVALLAQVRRHAGG